MTTRVVLANSKPVVDFSKYARPELITAVSRVADFFGDAVQSVAVPPVCLILITLLLTYFLPFSSTLASILFLVRKFYSLNHPFTTLCIRIISLYDSQLTSDLDSWNHRQYSYRIVVS
jgi:hypothetical protein